MKVSFATLWGYCTGWFLADGSSYFLGWSYNFKEDFAVAFFIGSIWAIEKIFPSPVTRPHSTSRGE
jgi:hypothetical protein